MPDRARLELDSSQEHLARIAIPYALSVHEHYMNQVKDDLVHEGVALKPRGKTWNAENMHEILMSTMGSSVSIDRLSFDLLRRLRNSLIHLGGAVDSYLEDGVQAVTGDEETRWTRVVGRPPSDVINGQQVSVGAGEVMLAFSVVRHHSKVIHDVSLGALPRSFWLKDCIEDFMSSNRQHLRSGHLLKRRLQTWAEHYFEQFAFAWSELETAARLAGIPSSQLRERNRR